jgi:hypothetical protein
MDTVKIEVTIPRGFLEAARLICDTFKVGMDEFVENAFRAELQSAAGGGFESYAHPYLDGLAKQVEAMAGESL